MKKRLLSLVLALVLCLGMTVPALAADLTLVEGTFPTPYDGVGGFYEGLAFVEVNGKCGFIDKTGKEVIPCKYDGVRHFQEGLAAVELGGKWGYIDAAGTEIIPCKYEALLDFSDGLAAVKLNGKWGFIGKDGSEVIPFQYGAYTSSFTEGLAVVNLNGKFGYIDKTGQEVISCKYEDALDFSNGFGPVKLNGKWGFVDKTGQLVVPCKYDDTIYFPFQEGLAGVARNDKFGYVDPEGNEVIPCKYDFAYAFYDGFAAVRLNRKYGFIDKEGNEVIPIQYDAVFNFSDGLAMVEQGGKRGFIDTTGAEVIPCKYESGYASFESGFTAMKLDGKFGYIDRTGKVIIPFKYDGATDFFDGVSFVAMDSKIVGYVTINTPALEVTAKISEWAKESVDAAAVAGLIADGLGEDYTKNITRAQFAAVSVKLYEAMSGEKASAAGDSPFTDTNDPAVIRAEALGFVGGVGGGKFEPDSLVTREQAATMLSRVYTKLGGEIPAVDATTFADDGDMSGYAKASVAFMADKGIVGGVGDNKFDPQGNASIEQALIIALRMFEKLK